MVTPVTSGHELSDVSAGTNKSVVSDSAVELSSNKSNNDGVTLVHSDTQQSVKAKCMASGKKNSRNSRTIVVDLSETENSTERLRLMGNIASIKDKEMSANHLEQLPQKSMRSKSMNLDLDSADQCSSSGSRHSITDMGDNHSTRFEGTPISVPSPTSARPPAAKQNNLSRLEKVDESKPGRRRWKVENQWQHQQAFGRKARYRSDTDAGRIAESASQDIQHYPIRVTPDSKRDQRPRSSIPMITIHRSLDGTSTPGYIQCRPRTSHTSRCSLVEQADSSNSTVSSHHEDSSEMHEQAVAQSVDASLTDDSEELCNLNGFSPRRSAQRKQWAKPNPDLLLQFCQPSGELSAESSKSQVSSSDTGSKGTPALPNLVEHPSVVGMLSTYASDCISRSQQNFVCWLDLENSGGSEKAVTSPGEDGDDVWVSCRENGYSSDTVTTVYDSVTTSKDSVVKQSLAGGSAESQKCERNIIGGTSTTSCQLPSCPVAPRRPVAVRPPRKNESSASLGAKPAQVKVSKTSTFTNMEETFDRQCMSIMCCCPSRSSKLAWPQEALEDALDELTKPGSKEKSAAIQSIGRLAAFYPEVAEAEQLALVRGLAREICDPRTHVARLAVICLMWLFSRLRFNMVQCLTETYEVMLNVLLTTPCRYLRQDLVAALDHLVDVVVPQQAIQILVFLFQKYKDQTARQAVTRFLASAIEKKGSNMVLQSPVALSELVLHAAAKFAEDDDLVIRANGIRIIRLLEVNPVFEIVYKGHLSDDTVRLLTPFLGMKFSS